MRYIKKLIFLKLFGWSITGDVPRDIKKYLIIVAPHSSNLDFIVGLFVRSILKFKSGFLAKKELFRFPFGILFRSLGGFPVDRSSKHNMVDQVVELINTQDRFVLAVTPEGTRKNVTKWKTGFYHIALKANIPLVLSAIDYTKRNVRFSEPFYLTGNASIDALFINNYFKDAQGKNHKVAPFVLND